MSAALLPVWGQIEKYLDAGLSIIPVRDKDDSTALAKTPYYGWKKYQKEIIGKDELFHLMDIKFDTTAVALICGQVSGNLEVIDIDCKYYPGIEAALFQQMQFLTFDTFEKLRIHKTVNGGFHVLYRCAEGIEGNKKLASRPANEAEIAKNPKHRNVCFIETRGEGGYVLAPPSLGYSVLVDLPIPAITAAERATLLAICKGMDETVQIEKPVKESKRTTEYYDTNPFDDYNYRVDAEQLANGLGWSTNNKNAKFTWFTRPGKKSGVSMSFNHEKRFFFCFTASTDLEEGKGYTPANLLCALQFNGDKKLLYAHLIAEGYGAIKPTVEKKIVQQAVHSSGFQLPANLSQTAISQYTEQLTEQEIKYPAGIFWQDTAEGVLIDRELLYAVSEKLGYKLYLNYDLVKVEGNFISKIGNRQYYDELKAYINEDDPDLQRDICNAWELFIEKHGTFTISRLAILERDQVLADTKDVAYKYYQNGVLVIQHDTINLTPYTAFEKLIWRNEIQERPYLMVAGGKYVEFLQLATGLSNYVRQTLGFLSHQYKDEATPYIIVCTEMCVNPEDGGGTGKNIFCKLFQHTTSYASTPGSQTKYDEKFFNSWNGERIFCISDVPKHFDYQFLKEFSSGSGKIKKVYKDEKNILNEDMPKLLVQTNFGVDIKDGGVKRRVKIVEFTNFFTACGGVDVHFGGLFPNCWGEDDWAGYDTCIAESIQMYLKNGRKIEHTSITEGMWQKQFTQEYGEVANGFITENIEGWITQEWVSYEEFKADLDKYYLANGTPKTMQPSLMKINKALEAYCTHHKHEYRKGILKKEGYNVVKKRFFGLEGAVPF